MADSTLSNLTSLTLPSQATDLLLVGRGTARPNKVAMSDALNSAALAATTAAYGVVLLAPNGGTTAGTVVQANDSRLTGGGGGGVTSLAGTANQISVSAATGAVTLSLPSTLILPGTLTVPNLLTSNGGINVTTSGFTQTLTGNEIHFSRNSFNYVFLDGGTSANLRFLGTTTTAGDTGILNLNNTQVAVLPTTNSTSKTTGALVIGDGTNGGLGVSNAITLGGRLNAFGTAAALTHQLQEAPARVVVLRVGLEMFVEIADALAEERDLHFGRSGVTGATGVGGDDLGLVDLGHADECLVLTCRRQTSTGLVQQQHLRRLHQGPRQSHALGRAARQRAHRRVAAQSQALQGFLHTLLPAPTVVRFDQVLQRIHVAITAFVPGQPAPHIGQALRDRIEHARLRLKACLLLHISAAQALSHLDLAIIGRLQPRQNAQQR